jgi:predicted O-methyltransferase YrrM
MTNLLRKCAVLKDMFEHQRSISQTGEILPIHSNIPLSYAEALYTMVCQAKPLIVVEVGMAFGTSSLAILTALQECGQGKLITIDPAQTTDWKGCGKTAIERANFSDRHELIEDYNYNALPRLLSEGLRCGFAYIDGWHTFDYAFLDWWYLDKMLETNGVVGFNDCGWPAVDKVIRFVSSHRKYKELNAGLTPNFVKSGIKHELLRRLKNQSNEQFYCQSQDRYFRKEANWEPSWDFYSPF